MVNARSWIPLTPDNLMLHQSTGAVSTLRQYSQMIRTTRSFLGIGMFTTEEPLINRNNYT
jgi:hypothetical protein